MAGIKIVTLHYLIPKVCAWLLLLAAALFDAIRHRHVKRRGWQLQRALVAVVLCYVVQDILLLSFVALYNKRGAAANPVCGTFIAFTTLADTALIVRPCRKAEARQICSVARPD